MANGVRRLPNGNTFIAARNQLVEVDKDGKDVWTINRPNAFDVIACAVRLPSGGVVILTNVGNVVTRSWTRRGRSSKSIQRRLHLLCPASQIDVLPGGHVLIPTYNQNKVTEYDAAGKEVWHATATQPTCVQRLPNGHTLVSSRIRR